MQPSRLPAPVLALHRCRVCNKQSLEPIRPNHMAQGHPTECCGGAVEVLMYTLAGRSSSLNSGEGDGLRPGRPARKNGNGAMA